MVFSLLPSAPFPAPPVRAAAMAALAALLPPPSQRLPLVSDRRLLLGVSAVPFALTPCRGKGHVAGNSACYVAVNCSLRDYELNLEGPIEPVRPQFRRDPVTTPKSGGSMVGPTFPLEGGRSQQRRKKGKKIGRVSWMQASAGAGISMVCSFFLSRYVSEAFTFLKENPVVKHAPMGLSQEVNYILLSMVGGFGGLAVGMFGFTSLGLAMLAFKNFNLPASPPPPPPPS